KISIEGQKTLVQKVPEQSLNEDQYLIKEGDSLSSITKKIGHESVPFQEMLKAIYKQNPDAFIDGNMTQLSIGSVITLPQLDTIEIVDQVDESKNTEQATLSQVSSLNVSTDKNAESLNLVKRIRELRKELKQSKDNLSEMKERLSDKEILLQQKNIQLEALNTAITETKSNSAPVLMPVSAIKKPMGNQAVTKNQVTIEDSYNPISKAEMAKFKRDLLAKKKSTLNQIKETKEIEQTTDASSIYKTSLDEAENNFVSPSINEFVSNNYAYMTLSLLLGLLLIRYRRELYSYTYSTINYDQPTYYPIPDSGKLELKEKNISYHDPKMDEESYVDDELMPNMTNQITTNEEKIVIDPLLVEAKEDVFVNSNKEKEEAQQIEHCEHLVTELFDDLETEENIASSNEWTNIEKVCDNYIDKIKDTDSAIKASEDGPLLDGVTDFNHMMTDLLESLDKVDKSVKKYNISDKDFPEIVKRPEDKIADEQRLS
ncbi:MAG: FimV-like protein, partial [Cocleimonas sp.]